MAVRDAVGRGDSARPTASLPARPGSRARRRPLTVLRPRFGSGLVVMLADTDAGSLITASQSGASWGYRMVLPQLILVPILYVVQ